MLLQIAKAEFLQDGTQVSSISTTILEGVTRIATQDRNTVIIHLGGGTYYTLAKLKSDPMETPAERLLNRTIINVYLLNADGETMLKLI